MIRERKRNRKRKVVRLSDAKNNEIIENEENFDLTPKEQKFCEAYFRLGEKQKAAIEAGYSEKSAAVTASRLLKNDKCLAYIHAIQKRAREELHIDDNWAVLKAIDVYNRCMQAEPVMRWDYNEHKMVETGDYVFDSKGALKALDLIRTILGLGSEDDSKLKAAITIINNIGENDE